MALHLSQTATDDQRAPAAEKRPVLVVDHRGCVRFVNTDAEELLGYGAAEVVGHRFSEFLVADAEGGTPELFRTDDDRLINNPFDMEADFIASSGEPVHAVISVSPIRDAGETARYYAVVVEHPRPDRHRERVHEDDRRRLDPLTGLFNRDEFERRLDILIEDAGLSARTHALIYIDLDQFRLINDTSGHRAGDELLCKVARAISGGLVHGETAARLGGDEFAILLSNVDYREALAEARHLHELIQGVPFSWGERIHKVDASIGVVSIDEHARNRSSVLIEADAALFAAKEKGRSRVQFYRASDAKLSRITSDMEWVNVLNKALLSDSFQFVRQPILPLQGESPYRFYEILVRLEIDGEVIAPGEFLAAAERFGLAVHLDRWVIEHFFDFLEHHTECNHEGLLYTINLSGDSICQEDFLDYVLNQLRRFHVRPEIICFEITETAAISNFEAACDFIADVTALGCRFALDDFGSGMSSFGYLSQLAVDYVKIDGQFVRDIDENPVHEVIVRSITDISHSMGKAVISEYVTNDAVRQRLCELDVDFAQGFYLGAPEPLTENG